MEKETINIEALRNALSSFPMVTGKNIFFVEYEGGKETRWEDASHFDLMCLVSALNSAIRYEAKLREGKPCQE